MDVSEGSLSFDTSATGDSEFAWENEMCPRTSGRRGLPIPPSVFKSWQDSKQPTH